MSSGYELKVFPCQYRRRNTDGELAAMLERVRPDGILVASCPSSLLNPPSLPTSTSIACVKLFGGFDSEGCYAMRCNDREAITKLIDYLVSLGHARIAFICEDSMSDSMSERYLGYLEGLEQNGLRLDETLVLRASRTPASGAGAALELLALSHSPTAIVAADDLIAAGVLRATENLNIAVPAGVSVAGFGDNQLVHDFYPDLTTVKQPIAEMAASGAQALIEQFGTDEALEGLELVSCELRELGTTGPVR